jgi:hypothetical protein
MPLLVTATTFKCFLVLTRTLKPVAERVVAAGLKAGPPRRIKFRARSEDIEDLLLRRRRRFDGRGH